LGEEIRKHYSASNGKKLLIYKLENPSECGISSKLPFAALVVAAAAAIVIVASQTHHYARTDSDSTTAVCVGHDIAKAHTQECDCNQPHRVE